LKIFLDAQHHSILKKTPPERERSMIELKQFCLGGFKSFNQPVEIDLSKQTLIFGDGDAGKSSILQALQYAREILVDRNFNCRSTSVGGNQVDLGGFINLVHNSDYNGRITLGLKISKGQEIPGLLSVDSAHRHLKKYFSKSGFTHRNTHPSVWNSLKKHDARVAGAFCHDLAFLPWDHFSQVNEISGHWQIGSLTGFGLPYSFGCCELTLAVNGVDFLRVNRLPMTEPRNEPVREKLRPMIRVSLNLAHPLLPDKFRDITHYKSWFLSECRKRGNLIQHSNHVFDWEVPADLVYGDSSECGWKERLTELAGGSWLTFDAPCNSELVLDLSRENSLDWFYWDLDPDSPQSIHQETGWGDHARYRSADFTRPLTANDIRDLNLAGLFGGSLFIVMLTSACRALNGLLYLGFQRQHYRPRQTPNKKTLARNPADGLGCWDRLALNPDICEIVNFWMMDPENFNFPYRVLNPYNVRKRLGKCLRNGDPSLSEWVWDFFNSVVDPLQICLTENNRPISPWAIGTSYTQILPIVVAAFDRPNDGIVLLEYPESNTDLRQQAVLADLLATSDKHFVVETHSQAMLLRMLRRIRETSVELASDGPRFMQDSVSVYYVQKEGAESSLKRIRIDHLGNLLDPWPDREFELSLRERLY
jgi:hypothetical protein